MTSIAYAVRALYRTLRDELPARVAALNAAKQAGQITLQAPKLYEHDANAGGDLTGAAIFLQSTSETPDTGPDGLHVVRVGLHIIVPGPARSEAATLDATNRLVGAVREIVRSGDGRGQFMVGGAGEEGARIVRCFPRQWQLAPSIWTLPVGGPAGMPIGRALPQFEIKVWDPDQ